jgi:hypothetical protein
MIILYHFETKGYGQGQGQAYHLLWMLIRNPFFFFFCFAKLIFVLFCLALFKNISSNSKTMVQNLTLALKIGHNFAAHLTFSFCKH